MRLRWVVVTTMAALAGCGGVQAREAKPVAAVEVEAFKLTKAEVKAFKGASGGKVVQLMKEESEAEITLPLKKGTYELVVYGWAPSFDEDAFWVHVGELLDQRMVIPDVKKILATKPLRFEMKKDGPCRLVIELGEENVLFDRVEIRRAKE